MNGMQAGAFFMTPTTLMPLIVADFRLNLSLSTVPIAVGKIVYVLLLIPGGIFVDRFGPRRTVLLGLTAIATILSLYCTIVLTFHAQVLAHILLACAASVSGVPVYSIFIAQWFRQRIGLAMGLVLAGYSAAGTLVPALLGPIATAHGWRVAMGFMAATLWLAALPTAYLYLHENEADDDVQAAEPQIDTELSPLLRDDAQPKTPPPERPARDGLQLENRALTFAGFALSYILLQYCVGCFFENILFFLHTDVGVPLATASLYFSVLNLCSFIAKIAGGHLGDRYDRFRVAQVMSALAAVAVLVLFCTTHCLDTTRLPQLTVCPTTILAFSMLFGFGYGGVFNSLYSLVPLVFGRTNLGATQSSLFGFGLAANALGSVLTGVLRERTGSYQIPFLLSAAMCILNFATFSATRYTLRDSLAKMREAKIFAEALSRSQPYLRTDELQAMEERENAIRERIASPVLPTIASRPMPLNDGDDGMLPVDGFPIAKNWSNSNLLRSPPRSRAAKMRRSSTAESFIRSGVMSASVETPGYLGSSRELLHRSDADEVPAEARVARSERPSIGTADGGAHERSVE